MDWKNAQAWKKNKNKNKKKKKMKAVKKGINFDIDLFLVVELFNLSLHIFGSLCEMSMKLTVDNADMLKK